MSKIKEVIKEYQIMLNKEDVLDLTDRGLKVFQYFVSGSFQLGRNFLNPLYKDNKPSCNIYLDKKSDCYKMKNFGNDDYSGDCFAIVAKIKGLDCVRDFSDILEIINNDLNLGLNTFRNRECPNQKKEKQQASQQEIQDSPDLKIKPYQIVQQAFTQKELDFWVKIKAKKDVLKRFKVISLKHII